jgi:hypothetical protein
MEKEMIVRYLANWYAADNSEIASRRELKEFERKKEEARRALREAYEKEMKVQP